jgi:hypothetical protein
MTGLQKFIMDLQKVAETGDSTCNSTYDFAKRVGIKQERERIIRRLESYFELAQEPNEDGTANDNPEWDNGFQAAMALIKGGRK